jgi:hypothetical protein
MVHTLLSRGLAARASRFGDLLATHFLMRRALTAVGVSAAGLGVFGVMALGLPSTPQSRPLSAVSPALYHHKAALIEPLASADLTSLKTQAAIYNLTQRGGPLTFAQVASVIEHSRPFDPSTAFEDALSGRDINTVYSAYHGTVYGIQGIGTDSWLEYATVLAGRSGAPPETTGAGR